MKFNLGMGCYGIACLMTLAFLSPAAAQVLTAEAANKGADIERGVVKLKNDQIPVQEDESINFDDYLIGPSNLLDIKVTQDANLSRTLRVDARGDITLPLLGVMHAAGLTPKELEQKIAKGLEQDYIRNPDVIVFVREYSSLKVIIQGQVLRPGIYSMIGKPTLLESISTAGGVTERADTANVKLIRGKSAKRRKDNDVIEIYDYEAIKNAKVADPVIEANDTIFVDEAVPIIVEGAVLRPGVIYPKPRSTLMQVISLAGGLRELGDGTSIKVYSPETHTGRISKIYDIERIREGKDMDPQLIAGNVVVVEEAGGRALMYGVGRFVRDIFRFGAMPSPVK